MRTLIEKREVGPPKNRRKITKLIDYIRATCSDDGAKGGLEYDFQATFVYDDGTTDVDTNKQKCGNPPVAP